MSKHTPGPWLHAHREGDDGCFRTEVFSADDSLGVIANCAWVPHRLGNGVTGTYREANARLIAAAPDLLEALQEAIEQSLQMDGIDESKTGPTHWISQARSAIAKATGEQS